MKAVGGGPPPVPGVPGATVPPPVPNANPQPGLNSQPPPIPNVPGVAVPPPVPQQQQQRLTPQEMAERSRNAAQQSNAYRPPTTQPAAAQQPVARRPNPMGGARNALL